MKRTLLAACLIISMLIGSCNVFAAGKPVLKEEKQIRDAGGDLRFAAPIIYKDKGEQKMFCDPDGKEFPDLLEWEKIEGAYDYIYALKDGVWHVFSK